MLKVPHRVKKVRQLVISVRQERFLEMRGPPVVLTVQLERFQKIKVLFYIKSLQGILLKMSYQLDIYINYIKYIALSRMNKKFLGPLRLLIVSIIRIQLYDCGDCQTNLCKN